MKPKVVYTISPEYEQCLKRLHGSDDSPRYWEVVNKLEGLVYDEYGVLPELERLYTDHAPFCAWAAAKHGIVRLCLHCDFLPFEVVYYTDAELLEHLKKYADLWPELVVPKFISVVRVFPPSSDRFACVHKHYYSLCLSRPDNPSDKDVVTALLGQAVQPVR